MPIQFPETAWVEWQTIAEAADAAVEVRKRIQRGTKVEDEVEKLKVRHEATTIFEQELEGADTPPVVIQTMADYLATNTPVLHDYIEGVVKENGVCVMLGPSSSGKSTLAVQVIHSLITGDDWLGQKVNKIAGNVALMSYDQSVAIPINWMSQMGIPFDRVLPIDLYGRGNPLLVPRERQRLVAGFKDANVEVVVLDSFSAAFSGDQNDTGLTMGWYKEAKKFAFVEVGAKALIVVLHSTAAMPRKPRGSTAHIDVCDSMVSVVRGQTNERTVSMEKYRAGLGQVEMSPVVTTAPDSVTHLVDLDLGAMTLAGLTPPPSAIAGAFPDLPQGDEAPDISEESDTEDDDL